MPFPPSTRVRYGKNPLVEVVCQLRFPTILRIGAESPAVFQERVRALFPEYRTARSQLPSGVPLPPDVLQMMFGSAGGVAHEFLTADGAGRVSLTQDFVALSVRNYTEWKDFRASLRVPLSALREVYNPPYFTRVGLRYVDKIDRNRLGLAEVPWRELLRAEVVGELADAEIGVNIQKLVREIGLKIPDGSGSVRVVHGLDGDGPESSFLIDVDYYTDRQVPTGETDDVLDSYNRRAGNLFRWCLAPRLHAAMDPRQP